VQNIGAYGVELKDVFHSLRCWHFEEHQWYQLGLDECRFGYRDSIFKQEWKNKTLITSVQFRLSKNGILNTEYGAITSELEKMGILKPTIREVAKAVMNIRNSKIPDPEVIPNAGSFFKNPVITDNQYKYLAIDYPDIPYYKSTEGYKIPAGWLLEKAHWKGYVEGGVGCYEKQALIVIHTGGATGKDILNFTEKMQASVRRKFGITLEREVNLVGQLPT
jgi:UDP-N-acetylmuramate dehydrogenase